MPPLLTPDGVDRVEVGIEMQHRQGLADPLPRRRHVGVGDRVIAADRQQPCVRRRPDPGRELPDALQRLTAGVRPDRRVPGIGHRQDVRDPDAVFEVQGLDVLRRVADRPRPEPRPGPIGHAAVERYAVERPVHGPILLGHRVEERIPAEGGHAGEPWVLPRVREPGARPGRHHTHPSSQCMPAGTVTSLAASTMFATGYAQ